MTLSAEPPAPSSTNGSSVASPTQRVVPGAPPPAALTKNQIRKRKQKASVAKLKNGDEPAGGLDIVESPRDAALVDHVPSAIIDTLVAGEDEVKAAEEPVTPAAEKAPSPIIDQVLNKRIKHFSKKLQRIEVYASNPVETLNHDQKVAIQTVPTLEAIVRELEETKKQIEAHESARASEIAAERALEAQKAEDRIREAVQFASAQHLTHTRSLVAFLALSTLLAAPIPINGNSLGDHRIPTSEEEKAAVIEAGRILLTPEFGEEKDKLIKGLLGDVPEGSFAGLSYSRFRAIVAQFIHPTTPIPSAPSSPRVSHANGSASIDFGSIGASLDREPTPTPAVQASASAASGFLGIPTSGSFQFMSASDLDLDPTNDITEQEAPVAPTGEWVHVEGSQTSETPSFGVSAQEIAQDTAVMAGGDVERDVQEGIADIQSQTESMDRAPLGRPAMEPISTTLDWANADEETDLPSIDSIHQQFGNSGAATPVSPFANGAGTPIATEPSQSRTNGTGHHHGSENWQQQPGRGRGGRGGQRYGWGPSAGASPGEPDADGFVSASRRGGRGDGFRTRRDSERGGRGGFRGDFGGRGGSERGHRGRGGEREHRAGHRGGYNREFSQEGGSPQGDSSGFRGRGRGQWDAEGRGGRGRGFRGRGDGNGATPVAASS